jgi:hypothetical protein
MAIRKDWYNPLLNITISNVYWRLSPTEGICGGISGITYTLEGFHNKVQANTNGYVIDRVIKSFIPIFTGSGSTDIIKQIYNHAKTLPFFSGSTDE